jgi:group I intron endonuclease
MGCIYRILCKINEKSYIGQFRLDNPKLRYNRHLKDAKSGSLCKIHEAIRKYGEEQFELITLCICQTPEELNKKEIEYIEQYDTMINKNGYNMVPGGKGRAPNFHHKEEHREKMSKLFKGRKLSEETKKKLSLAKSNFPATQKNKDSIADAAQKKFNEQIFPKRLNEWIAQFNKKGSMLNCNSEDKEEKRAAQWRQDMISKRAGGRSKCKLTDEQIQILDSTIGWTWGIDEFDQQLNNFKIQFEKYDGKLSRENKNENHHKAFNWMNAMRSKKRKNHSYLTEERIKLLEDYEHWSWTPTRFLTFEEHVNLWKINFEKNKRIPSMGSNDSDEIKSARWQSRMRMDFHSKEKRMTDEKIKTLDSMIGWKWHD